MWGNQAQQQYQHFDPSMAFKNSDLTPEIRRHVANVFAALAATVLCTAAGVQLHLMFHCGGMLSAVGLIAGVIALSGGAFSDNFTSRMGLLLAVGVLKGMSLGELVAVALDVDPGIVLLASAGTTAVFACFSGAALVAQRRTFLYLGAILGSVLSMLFVVSLLNMFVRSAVLFEAQLYVGLLLFTGYVVYDTQVVIEKAAAGSTDVVGHALLLWTDFVAIFVRLLVILLKNSAKNNEKNGGQRDSKSQTTYGRTSRR